jgi:hypothetical protein
VGRCLSKYWKSLYYWAADSNGSTTAEADDKIDLAPVTEDSMTEQDKPDEVQVKPQTTPPSEDLPPPEAEAPPPDTIPFPSERMPLNQAQQTIIKALEDDGNVRTTFNLYNSGHCISNINVYDNCCSSIT